MPATPAAASFDPTQAAARLGWQSAQTLAPESGWVQFRPTASLTVLPTFGSLPPIAIEPTGQQPVSHRGPAETGAKTFTAPLMPEEIIGMVLAQMMGAVSTSVISGAAHQHDITFLRSGGLRANRQTLQIDFDDGRPMNLLDTLFHQVQIQVAGGEISTVQYTLTYGRGHGWDRGTKAAVPVTSGPQLRGLEGSALQAELDAGGSLQLKVISIAGLPASLTAEVRLESAGAYAGVDTVTIPPGVWTTLLNHQVSPNPNLGLFSREPVQIYWPAATHAAALALDEWSWERIATWASALPSDNPVTGVHVQALFDAVSFPVENVTITISSPVTQTITNGFWREQINRRGQAGVTLSFAREMQDQGLIDRLQSRTPFRFEFAGLTGSEIVANNPSTERQVRIVCPNCIVGGDPPGVTDATRRQEVYQATAHPSSDPDWPDVCGVRIVNSQTTIDGT